MTTVELLKPTERCRLVECGSKDMWLRERAKSIGASDAAAILGASPFRTKLDVYAEKVQAIDALDAGVPLPAINQTEEMEWGNALEDPIARKFGERTGIAVEAPPMFSLYRSLDLSIAHASPDRFLRRAERADAGLLEVKTTSAWQREEWQDDIPLHYTVQIQQQLMVLGLEWGFVTVLIGGQRMQSFEVAADHDFHALLVDELQRFWKDHVEARKPPEATGGRDYEAARRLFKRATGGKRVALGVDALPIVEQLVKSRELKASAESAEKDAAARLILALQDAEIGVLPDGRRVKLANEDAHHEAKPAHVVQKRVLRVLAPEKGGAR